MEEQHVRDALAPLDLLRVDAVPAGLAERTLARVAAEKPSLLDRDVPTRQGWLRTRADLVVAVGILVCVSGLGLTGLNRLRQTHAAESCRVNLMRFYQGLDTYAVAHSGQYPTVGIDTPTAGAFVDSLAKAGVLDPAVRMGCAAVRSVDEAGSLDYAYALGFRDGQGQVQGVRRDNADIAYLPLLADRPLDGWVTRASRGNHSAGANVLFADGHLGFAMSPKVGYDRDNIYLNDRQRIAAGLHPHDAVLGERDDRP